MKNKEDNIEMEGGFANIVFSFAWVVFDFVFPAFFFFFPFKRWYDDIERECEKCFYSLPKHMMC